MSHRRNSAYGNVPVLSRLSCGSCTVYIVSIATDDVTERVVYICGAVLYCRLLCAMENNPLEKLLVF